MYINGRTGAVQGWVAVYKCPPRLCTLPGSAQHCDPIAARDLCVRSRSCDH
ncbi:unnamed protein product [Staurois parvus]|uniref:Uncharacterized protein n=1 Tax=Staurois parvus TaxID=386267 RepID=A0ABN9HKU7_9NEOB|nr:unnamed protein product [Staurois parvus]